MTCNKNQAGLNMVGNKVNKRPNKQPVMTHIRSFKIDFKLF